MGEEKIVGATVYFNDYMRMALNSLSAINEWLPSSPVDVDEQIYVSLGGREYYDEHVENLEDFIAGLRAIAKKVPSPYEPLITLKRPYSYDDDPANPEWEIGYWRDPTKKERAEREETNRKIVERDKARDEQAAIKEREEFERLKAKFGG